MQRFSYFLASALAIGGFITLAQVQAADPPGPAERAGEAVDRTVDRVTDRLTPATKPSGAVKELAPDYEDIRTTLGKTTHAAYKSKNFSDFVGYFVDFDRNRLSKYAKETDFGDLNAKLDQFRADWKAKYNHDFDFTNKMRDVAFGENNVWIVQAEIGDSAKLASGKLTGPNAQLRADIDKRITSGAGNNQKTGMDKPGSPEAQKNLNDPGRNIALITFPAGHGLPQLDVPFIHEMPDNWRIDVPDDLDGPRLRDNFMKHLTMVTDMKAQWPADENEAYAIVAHHVFTAIMDSKGDMMKAGDAVKDAVKGNMDNR